MKYDLRFKKLLRQFIVGLCLMGILLYATSDLTYAQVASESALSASPSADATSSGTVQTVSSTANIGGNQSVQNPFDESLGSSTNSVSGSPVSMSTLLNASLGTNGSGISANIRQPMAIGKLTKKSFKSNETVQLSVANANTSDVVVTLTDPTGKSADIDNVVITKTQVDSQTVISVEPPQSSFRPGKYTLTITASDGTTSTQNFEWGVLALNTNKSMYTPGQTAQIAMAVLDDTGNMVCNAKVSLNITSPQGTTATLSTDNGGITVNPQCTSHAFSLTPDYEASFSATTVGNYPMTLTATTQNGTYSISDNVQVVQSVSFDVERVTATRLYPQNRYPMTLHITANQDFSGTITDYAPASFDIAPATGGIAYDSTTLVVPTATVQEEFGVASLSLTTPFHGTHKIEQGFGEALTDPVEQAYYEQFGLAGHDGLDFAMNSGVPILATDDGVVVLAGDSAYGMTVVIQHSWGKSYYGHLSKTEVSIGQKVTKGEEIGLSGMSGHVTGPHLHFGIKPRHPNVQNGFYGKVDPMPFLTSLNSATNVLGISTTTSGTVAQKVISWTVHLKKGDKIELSYSFKAPPISPQFYTLGPLTFTQGQNQVFQEARLWQLANDAGSTAGPNNCGTAVDGGGTNAAWSTPQNACTTGSSTTATVPAPGMSNFLQIKNFGFTSSQIPSTAVIKGIQFTVIESENNSSITDQSVLALKAGTQVGTEHGRNAAFTGTVTYGTTSDLWGSTWTPTDITNSGFGIAIQLRNTATHGGSKTGTVTAFVTSTITYDVPPNTPTSQIPTNGSTASSNVVDLKMTATDPDSDNVQYVVSLYSGGTCSGSPTTYDQGTSQANWTGTTTTCSVVGDCYTSGTQGDLHISLSASTQYSWTVVARDPLGTNTLSSSTSCINFTSGTSGPSGPTLDQLLKHGEWFSSGVEQPFTF